MSARKHVSSRQIWRLQMWILPVYGIEDFQIQLCYTNSDSQSNSFNWNGIAVFINVIVEILQFRKHVIYHAANSLSDFSLHIACPSPAVGLVGSEIITSGIVHASGTPLIRNACAVRFCGVGACGCACSGSADWSGMA